MKLRLAVLSLLFCCSAAHALIKVADARVYDIEQNGTNGVDRWMSWAAADANVIQAWQDVYYNRRDAGETPANGTADGMTRSQTIYDAFLAGWKLDGYSYIPNGFTWWFQGGEHLMPFGEITAPVNEIKVRDQANTGYYNGVFGNTVTADAVLEGASPCFNDAGGHGTNVSVKSGHTLTLGELKEGLDAAFAYKGHAAALGIYHYDSINSVTTLHALTCWGYEADADGTITTLYVTDSADGVTDIVKLGVNGNGLLLPENADSGYTRVPYYLKSVTSIATPAGVAIEADTALPADGVLRSNAAVNEETRLDHGLSVGEGYMLLAEAALHLTAAEGTGLRTAKGTELLLHTASVSNAAGRAMELGDRAVISNGELSISGNGGGMLLHNFTTLLDEEASFTNNAAAGNGGAVAVAQGARLEITAQNTVPTLSFSGNHATGNGGAVYNEGVLIISNLMDVSFTANEAQQGSAIYTTGSLSVKDLWGELTVEAAEGSTAAQVYNSGLMELAWVPASFRGSKVAIENDGTLYLGADEGGEITLENSSLRSRGTTHLGVDYDGSLAFGSGLVFTLAEQQTLVGSAAEMDAGLLRGAELSATAVTGLQEDALLALTQVQTDGSFKAAGVTLNNVIFAMGEVIELNKVTTDAGSSYTAQSITLQDTVLTLEPLDDFAATRSSVIKLDASGIFNTETLSGSLTLVQEDLLAAMRAQGATGLAVDFGGGVTLDENIRLTIAGLNYTGAQGGVGFFTIPEPTAPLLTLTGVVLFSLRRRRR